MMKKRMFRALGLVAVLSLSTLAARAQSGWVYQGCWTQFSAGTCYDVYRDASGNYWRCKACRTTTNPSSSTCFRITPSTGLWCS